jgi:hypothetical protein
MPGYSLPQAWQQNRPNQTELLLGGRGRGGGMGLEAGRGSREGLEAGRTSGCQVWRH